MTFIITVVTIVYLACLKTVLVLWLFCHQLTPVTSLVKQ